MSDSSAIVEQWRHVRDDLVVLFRERQLTFAKAAERYEIDLHEDDFDYEFNYERVKKFWRKPPKPNASEEELKRDKPDDSRLPAALEYLKALKAFLLDKEGLVVGKKNSESKQRVIQRLGIDAWNVFHKKVIKRVEDEESREEWG